MKSNFDAALEKALAKEFGWLDGFENPRDEYGFTARFEDNMRKIASKAEFAYISVGRKRVRKALVAVLIALMALIITGCALSIHYLVEWNETQNDKQGTLDVTFELEEGAASMQPDGTVLPTPPADYIITDEYEDGYSCSIEYADHQGGRILYHRYSDVENMGLSIDNEDADFEETTINGCKGYACSKEEINALYWVDGMFVHTLQGTCEMDVLMAMAESMGHYDLKKNHMR